MAEIKRKSKGKAGRVYKLLVSGKFLIFLTQSLLIKKITKENGNGSPALPNLNSRRAITDITSLPTVP